jgi:hypothetical protein
LPPAAIELDAKGALALITHIQIAAANPAVKYNPLQQAAIAAACCKFNRASILKVLFTKFWSWDGTTTKRATNMYHRKY